MGTVGLTKRSLISIIFAISVITVNFIPVKLEAQSLDGARAAIKVGNYIEAVSILRDVLSNGKKNTDAHYLLGMALKWQGHNDDALS